MLYEVITNGLNIKWKEAIFYKTVISDLSDLADVYYDVLVFFSPSGIESLFTNFPDFKQNNTRIAVFGNVITSYSIHYTKLYEACGTPSNTSKKVSSFKALISVLNDLLNKILEALSTFSKSSFECTNVVTSCASRFCSSLKCGMDLCSSIKASMVFLS